jgi:hypothetical protein
MVGCSGGTPPRAGNVVGNRQHSFDAYSPQSHIHCSLHSFSISMSLPRFKAGLLLVLLTMYFPVMGTAQNSYSINTPRTLASRPQGLAAAAPVSPLAAPHYRFARQPDRRFMRRWSATLVRAFYSPRRCFRCQCWLSQVTGGGAMLAIDGGDLLGSNPTTRQDSTAAFANAEIHYRLGTHLLQQTSVRRYQNSSVDRVSGTPGGQTVVTFSHWITTDAHKQEGE